MSLDPSTIRNRSFSQGLRGLDADEVYGFLDDVADRLDTLTQERDTLQERVAELEANLDKVRGAVKTARKAQQQAEDARAKAEAEKRRLAARKNDLDAERTALNETKDELEALLTQLQSALEHARTLEGLDLGGVQSVDEAEEPSTEERLKSLFPNQLPGGDGASEPTDSPAGNSASEEASASARRTQFQAIKEDVQDISADDGDASDEDKPPTEEMNRIWDVFEEA
jgi:DivIVA domain-containing protein